MTVSSTTNRWAYTGDGSTAAFAFTNRIFAGTDLKVYVTGILKAPGSDYVVSGIGSPSGGNVTFSATPAIGAPVVILRDVPATQGTDYAALGPFPAESTETALDRLTVLVQQANNRIDRTLRQPDIDTADLAVMPGKTVRAGKLAIYDADGNPGVSEMDAEDVDSLAAASGIATAAASAAAASAAAASSSAGAAADSAAIAQAAIGGVKISSNDTTGAPLGAKLVAGTGVTLTENNDGGNETLTVAIIAAETGDLCSSFRTSKSGWVLLDGRTIGDASSGATNRANADTENVFTLLWSNLANSEAAVSGGRGASAMADFAAHKMLTLPDARGRVIAGKDNMGGTTAGRITSAGSGVDGTVLGKSGGDEQLHGHTHSFAATSSSNGAHTHTVGTDDDTQGLTVALGGAASAAQITTSSDGTHTHTISGTSGSTGSGSSENIQPTLIGNIFIKL